MHARIDHAARGRLTGPHTQLPFDMTRTEIGVLLLLVALCSIVAAASPQFLSPANLQNLARPVGIYGISNSGPWLQSCVMTSSPKKSKT